MNLDVVQLELKSLLLCFVLHNLIKLKLYNSFLAQAVSSISECAM